jgi:hypothetical protein
MAGRFVRRRAVWSVTALIKAPSSVVRCGDAAAHRRVDLRDPWTRRLKRICSGVLSVVVTSSARKRDMVRPEPDERQGGIDG